MVGVVWGDVVYCVIDLVEGEDEVVWVVGVVVVGDVDDELFLLVVDVYGVDVGVKGWFVVVGWGVGELVGSEDSFRGGGREGVG